MASPPAQAQPELAQPELAQPGNGIGLLQIVLDFTEATDPALLLACLQKLIDRHPELRRTFGTDRMGSPDQVGAAESDAPPAIMPGVIRDWQHLDPDEAEWLAERLLLEDRTSGFGPGAPLLVRACCLLLPGGRTRFLITYHHLILDGIGRAAMLTELIHTYDANRAGRDYMPAARRSAPEAAVPDTGARRFWQDALAGLPEGGSLSDGWAKGRAAPAQQGALHRTLPPETLAALRETAASLNVPLAMVVYAAWAVCLHRMLHEEDIAFLTIRNLRAGTGLPRGPHLRSLVNSVPLRVRVGRAQTVAELVASVAEFWNAARPHAGARLANILAWSGQGDRAWDTNILFQRDRFSAWFADTAPAGERRSIQVLQNSDTPLTVAVKHGTTLEIHFQYWTEAFRPGLPDALAETFATILAGLAGDPARRVGDLPYLSASQREWIASASQGPLLPDTQGLLLHTDFTAQAARHPLRTALLSDDGALTYGDLSAAANALAHKLVAAGVAREEPVAILARRGAGCLIAILAVLRAGAAFLPLDTGHPDEALQRSLLAAGARWCLADPDQAARAAALGCEAITLGPDIVAARAASPPPVSIDPSQLAYLIATSGTTGVPKIVEIPHRGAANTIRYSASAIYAESDLDLVPWTDSPAVDVSVHQIFVPLGSGGTLVPIAHPAKLRASPHFAAFTTFGATPSMLVTMLEAGSLPPSLRAMMFGGESCPASLPARLKASTTIRRAANAYGPTEISIQCTVDDIMAPAQGTDRSIGRPIPNMRVELRDAALQPVVPGTLGEICISGIGLARGYRGRPDLTEAAFPLVRDPDGTQRRIYRSGDLGILLPDGRLEFHGRRDRQVKIRGMRVELDAVEFALGRLDGVSRAAAAMRRVGSDDDRLVGWVVAAEGHALAETGLRAGLAALLPAPMVPDRIILTDDIALTPGGKADLAALPAWVPALPQGPAAPEQDSAAEPDLFTLVAAVLKVPRQSLGEGSSIHNTAAWDSIRHIMIMMRLEEHYDIALSDEEIAQATTIADMRDVLLALGIRDGIRDREGVLN